MIAFATIINAHFELIIDEFFNYSYYISRNNLFVAKHLIGNVQIKRCMMKRFFTISFFIMLFVSCKSPYEMIRTGPEYPPLPKNAEIKLVSWSDIDKYEQIAIVDVGEFNLEKRTKYAMEAARKAGGEFIAAKLSSDEEKNKRNEYLVQTFVILRKKPIEEKIVPKQEAPREIASLPKVSETVSQTPKAIPEEIEEIPEEKADYSSLPRASFRMLLNETNTLKGEKFRGALYPIKYFRIPPELKTQSVAGKQLLMLSNQKGTAKVLLFIPQERYHDIQALIKEKKRFEFVYTPITVYRSKYPVLDYIDTIK